MIPCRHDHCLALDHCHQRQSCDIDYLLADAESDEQMLERVRFDQTTPRSAEEIEEILAEWRRQQMARGLPVLVTVGSAREVILNARRHRVMLKLTPARSKWLLLSVFALGWLISKLSQLVFR